jgi:hypothetical protein
MNCLLKAKQAAVQIGRLCRQMEITNFSQIRTYFFSFVVSQFHGQQLFTFPPEDYELVLMLFFRTCFSLPIGFPWALLLFRWVSRVSGPTDNREITLFQKARAFTGFSLLCLS